MAMMHNHESAFSPPPDELTPAASATRDWDLTYRQQGVVQNGTLPTVVAAAAELRSAGAQRILDLGCGTGRHALYLAAEGFEVWGCDVSPSALEILGRRAGEAGVNIELRQGDMRGSGLPDEHFDGIVCVWSTGHGTLRDLKASVQEMHRLLKPGGLLCVDFPSIHDRNCGRGIEIEPRTYLHPFLDHADVPHVYVSEHDVAEMLASFKEYSITPVDYDDPKYQSIIKAHWVIARK